MNYLITIIQSQNQRIQVIAGGKVYTSNVSLPAKTKFKVELTADTFYDAGVLNITEGELDSDITIRATAPKLKRYTVEIKQTPHQLITLRANSKLYTSTVQLPINTGYEVTIEADKGYEPGTLNHVSGVLKDHLVISATGALKKTYNYVLESNPIVKNLSYTNRDINALRNSCIEFIKAHNPRWTDFNDSDIGMTLVDVITGCVDLSMYYLDQQANECFLDRATEDKNIRSILRTMNYKIPFEVSTTGELLVILKTPHTKDIIIPKYTQFKSVKTNLNYVSKNDNILAAGDVSLTIPIMQGKVIKERETVAYMKSDWKYYLNNEHVADHSVTVKDSDGYWEEVDDAYLKYKGGRYFSVHRDSDGSAYILFTWDYEEQFLDDESSTVTISYLETVGEEGNANPLEINSIQSIILDADGTDVTSKLVVRNHTSVTGGQNTPDSYKMIVDAKANARHMGRLVTLTDYAEAVQGYPGVYKSVTEDWSVNNTSVKKPYQVISYIVSKDGTPFSPEYLATMKHQIYKNSVCINEFVPKQADFYDYNIIANIDVASTNDEERNRIRVAVINHIKEYFSYKNSKFGQTIYVDEIWYQIKSVSPSIIKVVLQSPTEDYITPQIVYPKLNKVSINLIE